MKQTACSRSAVALFTSFFLFSATAIAQTTWYVDAARPDNSGAGTSWATAEKELAVAINGAASGDQVWVKAGTYKPTSGADRNASFELKNGVAVYGGFAGTETQLFQRNDIYNITILSGDLLGNDVGFTNNSENSKNVVTYGPVGNATILDGFTVTKGNSDVFGGGIGGANGSPVLANIVFTNNASVNGGGAAYFEGGSPMLNNCVFDNNVSTGGGGAVHTFGVTSIKFTNCVFYNNTAAFGGALYINGSSGVSFINCTFSKNTMTGGGGPTAAYVGYISKSDVSIKNTIIRDAVGSSALFFELFRSNFTIYYSLIQLGWAGIAGTNFDPLLVDVNDGDGPDNLWRTPDDGLRISCSSPAIDVSDPSITNTRDIMGITRTGIPDIGAYESGSQNSAAVTIPSGNSESVLAQNATGPTDYATCTNIVASVNSSGSYTIAGTVTTKVWLETAQPAQYVKRHYEITPAQNATAATGLVTLYFTQQEFDDFNAVNGTDLPTGPTDVAGKANLRVESRPGTSSSGTGLPGTYVGTPQTIDPVDTDIVWNSVASRWEVSFEVAGFGAFFVKTTLSVLPLRLMSFSGSKQPGFNKLDWKTAQEVGTKLFEVERSGDGSAFSIIQTVAAKGGVQNVYEYNDALAGNGIVYYRLRMLDTDAKFTYSNIIKLGGDNAFGFSFAPNPVNNTLSISITSPLAQMIRINLVDVLGRTVITQKDNVQTGANILTVDVSALSKGTYFLKVEIGSKVLSEKLIIN